MACVLRSVRERFYCADFLCVQWLSNIPDGKDVWGNVIPFNYSFRSERPGSGGFSGYGFKSDRDDPCAVRRPDKSDQNSETDDYGTGPFKDRGTEKGGPFRI